MALTYTPPAEEKFQLPSFQLPHVLGNTWKSDSIMTAPAKVVVFMCNHCPYVKAIESRLISLAAELQKKGVPLVGICSNDPTDYPEDKPEELKKTWLNKKYEFVYLIDENQTVAKAFDAVCTPDFFVFDKKNNLAYRGRLDDSWKNPAQVTREELKIAVQSILENKKIPFEVSPSMGCSIKWR